MTLAVASPDTELSHIERAAVLIMYLERAQARKVLRRLDDDEVRTIGMAMASIENVEPGVIERVVGDFIRDLHSVSMMPTSGAEYVTQVLPELLDAQRVDDLLPVIHRRVNKDFEVFISARPPAGVAAFLRDEHPQTQAVALSLMGPENAARVLRFLPEVDRSEITMRMARLKRIPGELADDVIVALRHALGPQDDHIDVGGVDRTARVLGRMRKSDNDRILDLLSDVDPDLADSLRRRMFVFEDLSQLNNRGVQAILKGVERDDLLIALKAASLDLRELFLANVSSRAAADLRDEIEILGPVARNRSRESQERIVEVALQLAEEGTIYLPMGDEDAED